MIEMIHNYLSLYKQRKKLQTVLALCFTSCSETYHHWRAFASGSGGVCIRFHRAALLKALRSRAGLRTGKVKYLTLAAIRKKQFTVQQLPFLKRYAFGPEKEYRVVFESADVALPSLNIGIPLSAIHRITLSPWIHPALSPDVKRTIKSIKGCSNLEVVGSTLLGNTEWKNHGESAA